MAFLAVLSSAVTVTVTVIGGQAVLLWWAYKRGEEAGERKADRAEGTIKIEALEQQLAAAQAQLAAIHRRP